MGIQFDNLPKEKPNSNRVSKGRYTAEVFKSELRVGKESGSEYLNVSFKIDGGGFVNENYFNSDKPFLQYKLGQLLKACKVNLQGEGTLKDVRKVIQGKKLIVDVDVNDRGYGAIDYSGNNDGLYPIDSPEATKDIEETEDAVEEINPELDQAIETEDEDF